MYKKDKLETILSDSNEKYTKQLSLPVILRLINKLDEKGIKDIEVSQKMTKLLIYLTAISKGDTSKKKACKRLINSLIEHVKEKHDLVMKGSIVSFYISIFIGAGVAIGAGLSVAINNPALVGVGIAIGAGIGVAIGMSKEKEFEREGKTY